MRLFLSLCGGNRLEHHRNHAAVGTNVERRQQVQTQERKELISSWHRLHTLKSHKAPRTIQSAALPGGKMIGHSPPGHALLEKISKGVVSPGEKNTNARWCSMVPRHQAPSLYLTFHPTPAASSKETCMAAIRHDIVKYEIPSHDASPPKVNNPPNRAP